MLEVFESRRAVVPRPLIHGVHEPECNYQQKLAVYQAGFGVREVWGLVIDDIQPFFKVLRLNQREDGSDVGIMNPEQAFSKLIRW